jgi:hypothetical protein
MVDGIEGSASNPGDGGEEALDGADRPVADRRSRPLGSGSPRSPRSSDPDDHRARRLNRLRRLAGPASKSNTAATRSASAGPDATKATRSRAKERPSSSTMHRPRSSSLTTTATKPSQGKTRRFFNSLLEGLRFVTLLGPRVDQARS